MADAGQQAARNVVKGRADRSKRRVGRLTRSRGAAAGASAGSGDQQRDGLATGDSERVRLNVTVRPAAPQGGGRVREVCWQFGMAPRGETIVIARDVPVSLGAGQIVLITGPSGCGKSATLREVARCAGERAVWVDRQRFDPAVPIIEQVASRGSLAEATSILTGCGLGEPRLWLRRVGELSDGERFRARLARAVGLAGLRAHSVLLVDEFCAILHRRLACATAYNLRKMVSAAGLCMVVATTHDDLIGDLGPDTIVRPGGDSAGMQASVIERNHADEVEAGGRRISFFRRLHISRGSLRDYNLFDAMHYRKRSGIGPFDKVFVLRDGVGGESLGVVVYAYPPLSLHLRNVVTGGVYHRNGKMLNRDFRILRRLVIHPDVRGCGLAHWLVSQTLPQAGTKYVECLAAMGAVNPVFERAGMVGLGVVSMPARQRRLHASLTAMGVDPLAADFGRTVAGRQDVRRLVGRQVHSWLQATTGRDIGRIRSMTPEAMASAFVQLMGTSPIYYLWSAEKEEMQRLHESVGKDALL